MWSWLQQNSDLMNAIASSLAVVFWVLFFQLLLSRYRHRLRATILINRGAGYEMDAKCVITNMSVETVYIEIVVVTVNTEHRQFACSLSDLEHSLSADGDMRAEMYQGPLATGDFIEIGSFDDIIKHTASELGDIDDGPLPASAVDRVSIMIIGTYMAEDGIVAAEREFDVEWIDSERVLRPRTHIARQIRSWRKRRAVERYILEELKTVDDL